MTSLEANASNFLRTLDWTKEFGLRAPEIGGISIVRQNVLMAIQLLNHQREQAIIDDKKDNDFFEPDPYYVGGW